MTGPGVDVNRLVECVLPPFTVSAEGAWKNVQMDRDCIATPQETTDSVKVDPPKERSSDSTLPLTILAITNKHDTTWKRKQIQITNVLQTLFSPVSSPPVGGASVGLCTALK